MSESAAPGTLRRLAGLLRPQRTAAVLAVAAGLGGIAAGAAGPLVLGHATDLVVAGAIGAGLPAGLTEAQGLEQLRADGQGVLADVAATVGIVPGQGVDTGALVRTLLLAVGLYAVGAFLALVQEWIATSVVQDVVYALRERVEAKLGRLPVSHFDRSSHGELLGRVTNDIDNLARTLQETANQLINSVFATVGTLVLMLVVSPLLSLVALLVVPLSVLVVARIAGRAQPHFAAQWTAIGDLTGRVEEAYGGHALVRTNGRVERTGDELSALSADARDSGARANFLSGTIEPAMMFLSNVGYVLVAVVGALRVATGALSIGNVQAFVQYTSQFSNRAAQIGSVSGELQSGVASAQRVFALLDAPEQSADPVEDPVPSSGPRPRPRGRVEFERVDFRYDPDVPVIDDLSLVAEPGATVAIVGPTGAGKTTLANLLMRFYEPDSGRILLDGRDITAMPRERLRALTGLVLQDTWLFEGTVADNIAYGRPGATRAEIEAAARVTRVDHLVRTLPDGYDTLVGEAGGLSAGEKQLLTVTRALLADPVLLILDEATSSVDTRSELLVAEAMGTLRAGRTSFVIAHRLSTVRDADLILVMDAGRIVERGTHDELVDAGGPYARLCAA